MKFNKENKKWVLTLGLLMVLGFNLSVHFSPKSGPEYAQLGATQEQLEPVMLAKKQTEGFAELSQEAASGGGKVDKSIPVAPPVQNADKKDAKDGKDDKKDPKDLKTTEGGIDQSLRPRTIQDARFGSGASGESTVVFERLADGTTQARHFKCKDQIKTDCVECNKAITNLNVEFTKGILELSTALSAAVNDCNPTDKKVEHASSKTKEELAKEKSAAEFAKLVEKCTKKDKKSQVERLECSIDGLTELLKNPNYEESDVKSFFSKYIKTPLQNELSSSNSSNTSMWGIADNSAATIYEFQQKLSGLTEKMKEMQDEILPDYSYLRKEIANISIRAIADKTLEINSYNNARNPHAATIATAELNLMGRLLPSANKAGLLAAVGNGYINGNYAKNLFGSIENYGMFSLLNSNRIGQMGPLAASELMQLSLMGMDSWDYQRGVFDPIGFSRGSDPFRRIDRFGRLSSASNLYDDSFFGDYRRSGRYSDNFFGRDFSRPFNGGIGRRQSRRGTGHFFSDRFNDSVGFNNSRGFNDNRLGILGSQRVDEGFRSFDRSLNLRTDGGGRRVLQPRGTSF